MAHRRQNWEVKEDPYDRSVTKRKYRKSGSAPKGKKQRKKLKKVIKKAKKSELKESTIRTQRCRALKSEKVRKIDTAVCVARRRWTPENSVSVNLVQQGGKKLQRRKILVFEKGDVVQYVAKPNAKEWSYGTVERDEGPSNCNASLPKLIVIKRAREELKKDGRKGPFIAVPFNLVFTQ